MNPTGDPVQSVRNLYLGLIERCLLNTIYGVDSGGPGYSGAAKSETLKRESTDRAHTEMGPVRMRNLLELAELALVQKVPGDFLEIGAGRGGGCVMLRAVLKAYGSTDRRVFCADSFPKETKSKIDLSSPDVGKGDGQTDGAASSLTEIKDKLQRYSLLDEQVVFLDGRLQEILPAVPTSSLALIRIGGGMIESTKLGLRLLYEKLSPGGYVIVDCVSPADRQAVDDFSREQSDVGPVVDVAGQGLYWRKTPESEVSAPGSYRLVPIPAGRRRPFWSVIVPVYERREFLKQCLESVLDQDPGQDEMEITVWDDASSIDLRGYVSELGRGRVNYFRNPTNLRQHATTNQAITKSAGRWIHILHDDDWVLPGFYATLRRGIESAPDSVGVAFCMYSNWIQQNGTLWTPKPFREGPGLMDRNFLIRLSQFNPLNYPAIVYQRETFERVGFFREDLPCAGDWEWFVRSAVKCAWHHQPENLARYRMHDATLTQTHKSNGQRARGFRRALESIARHLPADIAAVALPPAREFHARHFFNLTLAALKAGNQPVATRLLYEALAIDPDGPARPEFGELLRHAGATVLRRKIRADIMRTIE